MNNSDILADKLDFTYKKEENLSEVRNFITLCLNYWYIFLISIVLCVAAAFLYIRHLPNQWAVSSKIIVEDNKEGPEKSLTSGVNADLGSLFDIKSNADNEVEILKSRSLIKSVITALDLNVHILDNNGFRKVEMYADAPFSVGINYKKDSLKAGSYEVSILDNNHFKIIGKKSEFNAVSSFGKPVDLGQYDLTLNKTKNFNAEGTYRLVVTTFKEAEKKLSADFNASIDDKQATVIDLQLNYEDPDRGEVILQKLMQIYLQNNLANKVRLADSTMKFIDKRLILVSSQLNDVEKDLEQYKVNNKISDINAQSKALVDGADQYQSKLNDNQVQLAVVNSLYQYINDSNKPQLVPSSLITKDVAFGTAINAYNEMLLKREQLKSSFIEGSQVIADLDRQIKVAREALKNSLMNYRNSLQTSQAELKAQNSTINNQIANAPAKERVYLDYTRQQSLKQDLYLFLLQRREETAISQTATISSCRILDDAESDDSPFAPKKSLIYIIGMFAGVFLPVAGLSIKEMLNIRIQNKSDIERHTNVPLLGEISRSIISRKKLLVYCDPLSIISEEIRALRTNLKYITDKGRLNVIMFTSSMSGEGKSFISLNLANSIALSGKKVVLLELDLRKPRLLKSIGIDNSYGFTNYMISSDKSNMEGLIQPSAFNENFYMIASGPIPPNPGELLMDEKLKLLIGELKQKFDYVIIDTPPVGLVSDALLIEEFADITCYVVRQNFTFKSQLGIVNDLYKTKKVKQLYLVVNDIPLQNNAITGYGHGVRSYGYAMVDQHDGNKLNSLLRKLKPVTR
ncbi:capsular exopolysaccharide family [Mucilaginibacter mallensis]|uniref:non-specific protein-tyrosine kinase n=1 Tax=Mucilaginibacter mallensis TaxID=652787 RepID=A0A1H1WTV4_MUCMA|nr:polysaccharide biosynthesis tyrosine autokinase [Mucilaginibacter mallensis]SDT00060.1 capsular exopolysaccharide family [Mucilaginibacter mallensis]